MRTLRHAASAALAAASLALAAAPAGAATLTLVLENASGAPAATAPGAGFQGAPDPPLPATIAAGARVRTLVRSPYPGSAGASIRLGPAGAPRSCFVTVSRLREGLSGPWARPTTFVRADRGVACTAAIVSAAPDGDFEVVVRIE